jgi:4'-phosphopantetheinyl transferase EntD
VIWDLFPAGVCIATGPNAEDETQLLPGELEIAQTMGPSRRREFSAGRACARRALRELGAPDGPVLRGLRRAPQFPRGVVGSITHTAGFCAAAVARSESFAGVGLDAERDEALSERAAARICAPGELAALRALAGRSPQRWAAVVFSAKETLYKAYFPLTGFFIGFRDAAVALFPEADDAGRFEARLLRRDAPDAAGQRRFAGRYAIAEERVLTGLAIPIRQAPPSSARSEP